MGLGRVEPFYSGAFAEQGIERGPSFVEGLYNTKAIDEATFSL